MAKKADSPKESTTTTAAKRSWTRWILPVVALAVLVALGAILKDRLQDDVWAYYTDDEGMKVDAKANKHRMVLWADPQQRVFECRLGEAKLPS